MRSHQTHEQPRSGTDSGSLASLPSAVDASLRESELVIPAIEFRNVDFAYDEDKVLDSLCFQVAKGEIKIILSGSGGGKSTILKLVLGLLKPDAGQILIDGDEITECDEEELQRIRTKLGMVFQEGALFDSLSVYDNVAYRLHERELPEEQVEEEVRSLLQFVNLENELEKFPSQLSGGMQKRLSIARALVGDPMIVLFDEPTVGLDPITTGTICDLIIQLRDLENVASIVVTHEMDVVKYLTSEYLGVTDQGKIEFKDEGGKLCLINTNILMLRNGRAIFTGTSKELIESTHPYIQDFIRGTELLPQVTESRPQEARRQR
jgi:phospholipid/cholesterol/gamma-HCH transport system ATP-binding protein